MTKFLSAEDEFARVVPLLGRNVTNLLQASPGVQLLQSIPIGANIQFSIGYTVGGALVFAYAKWLVQKALDIGFSQLYFLARDGYIVKKAVDFIIGANNLSINTGYLYSSRRAWRLPTYDGSAKSLGELFARSSPRCLQDFANICQLDIDDIRKYLDVPEKQRLSDANAHQLILQLQQEPKLRKKIIDKQNEARHSLLAYLRQEIDFGKEKFALVDVQGSGYTSDCIAKLLNGYQKDKFMTFYYVITNKFSSNFCQFVPFVDTFQSSPSLMELLTRALHGQTVGYSRSNIDVMEPILKGNESVALDQYGYGEYLAGVEQACYAYASKVDLRDENFSSIWASEMLEAIGNEVENELFKFLSEMPISSNGHQMTVYAPNLSRHDWHMIKLGLREYRGANIRWSERIYFKNLHHQPRLRLNYLRRINFIEKYERIYGSAILGVDVPSYFCGIELPGCITLYGAGDVGQMVYYELTRKHKKVIKQWVDKKFVTPNYHNGVLLCNANAAHWSVDECIIIAMANLDVAEEVESELRERLDEIPNAKIINLAHFIDTEFFFYYLDSRHCD